MFSLTARREVPSEVAPALHSLATGEPVLVFDAPDREGETDLVFLSESVTPELVRLARKDAGGLICTAMSDELRRRLDLPFFADLLALAKQEYPGIAGLAERPRYDRRSAFGITINHRANFTGVPDNDRALTIRTVGEIARAAPGLSDAALREKFRESFISPGHIQLLYAAPNLFGERKGHTELAISLARMAGLSESATVCEMLGDSGGARAPDAARRYAEEHGFQFLEGRTIIEAWRTWSSA
ncbi:MAG TPA: 3,4-dihydroxy-2-butanone-4-phosphate synthase [Thermoplasmata archaeon]|nr:3,4-dihydroxy-2-butanone-4-phosphate synthase [Thermoplasmata archaeon]